MGRMWRAEKAVSRMGAMARAGAVNMDELSDAKRLLAHHFLPRPRSFSNTFSILLN